MYPVAAAERGPYGPLSLFDLCDSSYAVVVGIEVLLYDFSDEFVWFVFFVSFELLYSEF